MEYSTISYIYTEAIANPELLDDEGIEKLAKDWKGKIRAETGYMKPFDDLGIKIFDEDLSDQPQYPNIDITFGSNEILKKKIQNTGDYSKNADILNKGSEQVMEIAGEELSLVDQLLTFLETGKLCEGASSLIHELIHARHLQKARVSIDKTLSESHAHLSQSMMAGDREPVLNIAEKLSDPEAYSIDIDGTIEGLANIDDAIEGLTNIDDLRALGLSEDDIVDVIFGVSGHLQGESAKNAIRLLKEEYNIDDIDIQALNDIQRLYSNNQRTKAQILLYKAIEDAYSKEKLVDEKIKYARQTIEVPHYYKGGERVPSAKLFQNCVMPVNKEFPYDPLGKRTMIGFGLFENDDGKLIDAISRIETERDDSTVVIIDDENDVEHYLKQIKELSKNISFDIKLEFAINVIMAGPLISSPTFKKVIKSLFSKEEGIEVIKNVYKNYEQTLMNYKEIVDQITDLDSCNEYEQKMINRYRATVMLIKKTLDVFGGVNLSDVDLKFSEYFKEADEQSTYLAEEAGVEIEEFSIESLAA